MNKNLLLIITASFLTVFTSQCTAPVLVSNPPSRPDSQTVKKPQRSSEPDKKTSDSQQKEKTPRRVFTVNEVNFADAFDSSFAGFTDSTIAEEPSRPYRTQEVVSLRYPSLRVETATVRICLLQNVKSAVMYSVGVMGFHGAKHDTLPFCRGRVTFEMAKNGRSVVVSGAWGTDGISLPCTVFTQNAYNFIDLGEHSYRGTLILAQEKQGAFTVVNLLGIEEYLRGVVPLEIGKRGESEIEAMKAQAIAARTYTYKRMSMHQNSLFDLLCTVSDQVYGGADVEYRYADLAIKLTENLILTYGDSVIDAYYHSTCGGKTANADDVWKKEHRDYLVSVTDEDSQGRIYCKDSPLFSWNETWSPSQLSSILVRQYPAAYQGNNFKGTVRGLAVDSRFPCGRVKWCVITTSEGKYGCGGDQARFILRRGTQDHPILRSARFEVNSVNAREVSITGTGYGHGVGMCQMGALGRARAGQSFEKILKAYYTGVQIRTAVVEKKRR